MLSGGELIGDGAYGCIFTPPLKCKNKKTQQRLDKKKELTVSKIILTPFAKKENAVAAIIRKIPLWKNYFVVSETMCEPSATQKEKDLDSCHVIKDNKMSDFRLLFMPYGGQPLNLYRFNLKKFDFMEFATHLIAGGAILNLFGVVHRDIHFGNIVVDADNVPRIIDFNLAIFKEHSDFDIQLSHHYDPNYPQEPPDSTLVNAIKKEHDPLSVISSIFKKRTTLRKVSTMLNVPFSQMEKEVEDFYYSSKSVQKGDDLKWFQTYWRTIDSWAIGMILVELLSKLSMWSEISYSIDQVKEKLRPVLRGLCAMSPVHRLDCVQALHMIDPQHFVIRKYATAWLQKVGDTPS